MKNSIILLLGLLALQTHAQDENCWALKVQKKGLTDSSNLNEYYNSDGMYLMENGIYNFKILGEEYSMHRIQSINPEGITIGFATEDVPVLTFQPEEIDVLIFYALDDGKVGFMQNKIKQRKYEFSMIRKAEGCVVDKSKICKDRSCKDYIEGYKYMTAGYGWKPVYEQNGVTFMLDKTVIHEVKK